MINHFNFLPKTHIKIGSHSLYSFILNDFNTSENVRHGINRFADNSASPFNLFLSKI